MNNCKALEGMMSLEMMLLGCVAAALVGMSKTGVPGLGILSVLMMTLVFPGAERLSMGAMVPLLIAADTMAVVSYYRQCDRRILGRLLIPVAVGMLLGSVVLACLDDRLFATILAVLVLTLIGGQEVCRLFSRLHPKPDVKSNTPRRRWSWLFGVLAGAATMVGNAAGPVMSVYMMTQHCDKARFMGTFAVFFCLVNWTKLPVVVAFGMVTPETLWLDATLLPALVAGGLLGRHLFRVVPERVFFILVTTLNVIVPLNILITSWVR